MATAHSTVKARAGRNPLRKSPRTPKSPNRSKTPVKRRKTQPTSPHTKGAVTPATPGSEVAERGARIRVRGRLREMIQAELGNLGRLESVLRCLAHSMEYRSLDAEPYYPDIAEVAYRAAIKLAVTRQSRWQGITRHPDHAADDCRWQALRLGLIVAGCQ
jgi:hypothetical protein